MKKLNYFILLILLSQFPFAQVGYSILVDKTFSSITGAENLITVHKGLSTFEDRYIKIKWFNEDDYMRKSVGITLRLGKTILFDQVLDHYILLIQHEVLGHGARYREYGFDENSYYLSPPPPYGKGNGWAKSRRRTLERLITPHEDIAMSIAGSEADAVMANSLQLKWLRDRKISYREALLYLRVSNDLTAYILTTGTSKNAQRNDVIQFLNNVNGNAGFWTNDEFQLTLHDLKRQVLINFVNPFQVFSLWTYLKSYVWSAEKEFSLPLFNIKQVGYLPSFRLGLTPFGTEFYFENFVTSKEKTVLLYVRYGEPTFHKYWGVGFKGKQLWRNNTFTIDGSIDIWNQPALILGGSEIKPGSKGIGGAFFITSLFHITDARPFIDVVGQVGYKTTGFLQGEKLGDGIIIRVGLNFSE